MKHRVISVGLQGLPDELWPAMDELRNGQDLFRSPFFSAEFLRVIAAVREDTRLLIGETPSRLAYFCPLQITRGGTARGIGGPFSDRNGIVNAPDVKFNLSDLLEAHDIYKFISNGYVCPTLTQSTTVKTALNNETHIDKGFASYLEGQRSKYPSHFKRLRRLRRKLEKDFSEVEIQFDDRRRSTFEALIAMKRDQFSRSGRHDVLRPDWVGNMFSELGTLTSDSLRLRLSSMFVDGKLISAELNMQSNKTLHGWLVAFDPDYGKYSPGNLLTQFILENMSDYGLKYYDSGTGGDQYKKYVTNVQVPLGVGTFYAEAAKMNPKRILESAWSVTENAAPGKLAHFLQRSRRRSEQILATEIDNISRIRGYYDAMNVEI